MKTAFMTTLRVSLACLALSAHADIERMRHESAEDFRYAWLAETPATQPDDDSDVENVLAEYRLPGMRIAVATRDGRRLMLRRLMDETDGYRVWGAYPEGERFSQPLFAHGKTWLFALSDTDWRLYSASLESVSPEWRVQGAPFQERPTRFSLDRFGEPRLQFIDRTLTGRFYGGGARVDWFHSESPNRTVWEAPIAPALFGEFDLGTDRPLLSMNWRRGFAADAAIRYRVSLGDSDFYGPWSAWSSLEALPINRRGRFAQYQIRGDDFLREGVIERFVEIAYWVDPMESDSEDIEQISSRGGSQGGSDRENDSDEDPASEAESESESEAEAISPLALADEGNADAGLEDENLELQESAPGSDDASRSDSPSDNDDEASAEPSSQELKTDHGESNSSSPADPMDGDAAQNHTAPAQSNPDNDGDAANAGDSEPNDAASPNIEENEPEESTESDPERAAMDDNASFPHQDDESPESDADPNSEGVSHQREVDANPFGSSEDSLPVPDTNPPGAEAQGQPAEERPAPRPTASHPADDEPISPHSESGDERQEEADTDPSPIVSDDSSPEGDDGANESPEIGPHSSSSLNAEEALGNNGEEDFEERPEFEEALSPQSPIAAATYARNSGMGDPLALSASIRGLRQPRPYSDSGMPRRVLDSGALEAPSTSGAVSGVGRFATMAIEGASDGLLITLTRSEIDTNKPALSWLWPLAALLLYLLVLFLRRGRSASGPNDAVPIAPAFEQSSDPWVEEIRDDGDLWERVVLFRPAIHRIASSCVRGALLCVNGDVWSGPSPAWLCDPNVFENSSSWRSHWRFAGKAPSIDAAVSVAVGERGVIVMPCAPIDERPGRFYPTPGRWSKEKRVFFPAGVERVKRIYMKGDQVLMIASQQGQTAVYTAALGRGNVHKWSLETAIGESRPGPIAISSGGEALCAAPSSNGLMRLVVHAFDPRHSKRSSWKVSGIVPYESERLFIDSEGGNCFLIEDSGDAIQLQIVSRDVRGRLAKRFCCEIERPWDSEIIEAEVDNGRLFLLGRDSERQGAWRAASARLSEIIRRSSEKPARNRLAAC